VKEPGTFHLFVTYSCAKGAGGSAFTVSLGNQSVAGKTHETGAWNKFAMKMLGQIRIENPGEYTLVVQPKAAPPWNSMGLQAITLTPVK